jgi:hypothetical protein
MNARDQGKDRQFELFGIEPADRSGWTLGLDFNDLTGDDYLAIVVIDGDGLGDRITQTGSPEKFARFSTQLDGLIDGALHAALAEIRELDCPAGRADSDSDQRVLPGLVLFQGGDDIVIATRGQLALPLVQRFSGQIQACKDWTWTTGPVGFSAGVAIVRAGFPFRATHAIAAGLLRNAKRAARDADWAEGAVDYAIVTESFGDVRTILDEQQIQTKDSLHKLLFTGRPYRLAKDQPQSLSRFRSACGQLQAGNFPAGRLFDLRNALTAAACGSHEFGTVTFTQKHGEIMTLLKRWGARIHRVPQQAAVWGQVMSLIAPPDEGPSVRTIFPEADLADGLYLWGATMQETTHAREA